MGLPSTFYFLCFHCFGSAAAHSHFSTSYTAHDLLFLSFRAPLSPFNSLIISWACDPLFLPCRLNGFSIHLPTLFYLCCWASPFHLDFQNGHQQFFFFFCHYTFTVFLIPCSLSYFLDQFIDHYYYNNTNTNMFL